MDPITLMAIAGGVRAVGDILGSIIGNAASEGDRNTAERLAQEAYQKVLDLGAPPEAAKNIFLEQYRAAGLLTPQVRQAIEYSVPKVAQIKEDQKLKEAQMQALSGISQIARVGLTPEERYARQQGIEQAQRTVESQIKGQQQELARQGLLGSGAEIASRFSSADELRRALSQQEAQLSAQAGSRALEALSTAGTLAGNMQTQQFEREKQKAQAEDEFNRFNVQERQAAQEFNLQQAAQTQQYNLALQQQLLEQNIQQRNQERIRQANLPYENWARRAGWAQMQQQPLMGKAQIAADKAAQTQQFYGQLFSGLGQLGSAGIGAYSAASAPQLSSSTLQSLFPNAAPGTDFSGLANYLQQNPQGMQMLSYLNSMYGRK